MTQPALRLVSDTGEVVEQAEAQEWRERYEAACDLLRERDATIKSQAKTLGKLERDAKFREDGRVRAATKGSLARDVRDVLLYHISRFMGSEAKVIPGSKGWQFVETLLTVQDATTGKPAFTVDLLCESVDGAWLDDWYRQKPHRRYATCVFGSFMTNAKGQRYEAADPDKVQRNIDYHREKLGRAPHDLFAMDAPAHVVEWLAEECETCGHVRCQHQVQTGGGCCATLGERVCRCEGFVSLDDRIGRWREAMSSRGDGS